MNSLQPLGKRLLVRPIVQEVNSLADRAMRSGLYVPPSAVISPDEAEVVMLGTGRDAPVFKECKKDLRGIRKPNRFTDLVDNTFNVKVGDKVLLNLGEIMDSEMVQVNGEELRVVRADQVIGIITHE